MIASFLTDASGFAGALSVATIVAGAFAVGRTYHQLARIRSDTRMIRVGRLGFGGAHLFPEQLLILEHLELSGREASIAELTTEVRISPSRARTILNAMVEQGIIRNSGHDVVTVTPLGRETLRDWYMAAADAGSPAGVADFADSHVSASGRTDRPALSEKELDLAIDLELSRAAGSA